MQEPNPIKKQNQVSVPIFLLRSEISKSRRNRYNIDLFKVRSEEFIRNDHYTGRC